jgi:hypothetical protein
MALTQNMGDKLKAALTSQPKQLSTQDLVAKLKALKSKIQPEPDDDPSDLDDKYIEPPQVPVCLSCDEDIASGKLFCSECEASFSKRTITIQE